MNQANKSIKKKSECVLTSSMISFRNFSIADSRGGDIDFDSLLFSDSAKDWPLELFDVLEFELVLLTFFSFLESYALLFFVRERNQQANQPSIEDKTKVQMKRAQKKRIHKQTDTRKKEKYQGEHHKLVFLLPLFEKPMTADAVVHVERLNVASDLTISVPAAVAVAVNLK